MKCGVVVRYRGTAASSPTLVNTCFVVFAKDDIRIRSVGSEGFLDHCSGSSRALPRDPMRAGSQSYSRDRPHKFQCNVTRSKTVTSVKCTLNMVKQIEVTASVQPVFGVGKGRVTLVREYQAFYSPKNVCR